MSEQEKVGDQEFLYLPLGDILIEEQVRSSIDTESDSFKALMSSIKDRGVLEPVLVTPKDGKYLLLCGERRYLAAQKLGLPTILARVLDTITQKDEILAFQLTENLQREDLNPIDQAKGVLAYIQAKHPDKNYDVDGVMSELVSYKRRPEDLPEGVAPTVGAIMEITGKSITTLYNGLSLLKLFPEIQAAIRQATLPVSQGYLFAANLECPDLRNSVEF
jgi:ParB family chromosome partitioning protein